MEVYVNIITDICIFCSYLAKLNIATTVTDSRKFLVGSFLKC